MTNAVDILRLAWPIILIQFAIQIYAIYDIVKRKGTKNLSTAIWIVIILFGELIGSILYLLLGRKED